MAIFCSGQCGFSGQHFFLVMIKKLKEAVDNGYEFGALLTDLSKAFDWIDHLLLPAKRYGHTMSDTSLKLIFWFFKSLYQHTKINNCFSKSSKTDSGIPQGPILGPLFFNIDLIDMFYESNDSDIKNYADDTTPYTCSLDTDTVISKLQSTFDKLYTWFKNNHMKANPEKCHLLLSSKTPNESLKRNTGVLINSELFFHEHISLSIVEK